MIRIYIGFDDTDTLDCGRGTGKLARWFEEKLPPECTLDSIVRQQLLVADTIPYTSHNSSLVCVITAPDTTVIRPLIDKAADHIHQHFVIGSDPGLCVVSDSEKSLVNLGLFGIACTEKKMGQSDALKAAGKSHLSGHGGTNDGIIGAAAGVGLTWLGMSGRLNEIGGSLRLRDFPEKTTAGFLRQHGIEPFSTDQNAVHIPDSDIIDNRNWLRPRLFMGKRVVAVTPCAKNQWITHEKRRPF